MVYVDYRGSGRSAPTNPETYTLDDNIDDLDAFRLWFEYPAIIDAPEHVSRDTR